MRKTTSKSPKSRSSKSSKFVQREDSKFSKRKVEDRDANYDAHSKENDSAWYAQNAQLMSDVASFSYNYPVGSQMPHESNASRFVRNGSVPGIMTIHTTPRFGKLTQANDPINVAMRNVYSFVRHANAGSTNYEAPDLMLYLMAMDSCFSFIEMLKRVYGTILTYSFTNRYFPVAAVHAQGFNFADMQENIADFRAYINSLAVKVGSMCVPASMSYIARHIWMYSGMYYDTPENNKAQVYMYVPEAFYRFRLDSDSAGALTLVDFDRNKYSSDFVYPRLNEADGIHGWTFKDIVAFGNALIDPILMDEDMNIMSGDILKAFGAQNIYQISSIPEEYTVIPVYSKEVLEQIHNTALIGRAFQPAYPANRLADANIHNSIMQSADKTFLLNEPHCVQILPCQPTDDYDRLVWNDGEYWGGTDFKTLFGQANSVKRILDFENGPVTPAQAMVASRLAVITDQNSVVTDKANLQAGSVGYENHGRTVLNPTFWLMANVDSCGSETAGFAKIWYWAHVGYNSANTWSLIHTEDLYNGMFMPLIISGQTINADEIIAMDGGLNDLNSLVFSLQREGLLAVFNFHPSIANIPLFSAIDADANDIFASPGVTWPQFDINYYTVLDAADLKQMHEVALISEFNITQYGRRA